MQKKNKIVLISLILFLIQPTAFADPMERSCKDWSKSDWDNVIKRATDPRLLLEIDESDSASAVISEMIRDCPKNYKDNQISKCMDRIDGYYSHFRDGGEGTFSAIMSDQQYAKLIPKEGQSLPAELNKTDGLPENWKEIVQKNGWSYVQFQSRTGNTPRVVIRVPGAKYDQLLVYYTFKDAIKNPTKFDRLQAQVISKNGQGTSADGKPEIFFKDYSLMTGLGRPLHNQGITVERCIACHTSGPRAIVPNVTDGHKFEVGGSVKTVDEFNSQIVFKTSPDLSPYYNLKYFPEHLAIGQDCKQCHNGKERSSLATAVLQDGQFIDMEMERKVVVEETMPKELYESLNKTDREKFMRQLRMDYAFGMQAWLTETKCDPTASKPTTTPRDPRNPHGTDSDSPFGDHIRK